MQEIGRIETVYFVSVIRTPDSDSTSTHLMTEALLKGWQENNIKVTFFAICEHPEEAEKIKSYYSKYVERVIVLKSLYKTSGGKVAGLLNILNATAFQKKYQKEIMKKTPEAEKPDLILSHAPSFEAIPFANALKKFFHTPPFYQYWSDPMALSGIEPENFG